MNKSLGAVALEVFSIVLGVLLALGVSEWQEERGQALLARAALSNLAREIAANRDLVELVHENNSRTMALAGKEGSDGGDELQFVPGIQVRTNAWEALISSGASNHIDYDLLYSLSATYSAQEVYREIGLKIVDASMNLAAMATANGTDIDNDRFLRQFKSYFDTMIQIETILLGKYEEALAALEAVSTGSGDHPAADE